ncbi:hypothetical protein [Dongia sp. agr-C8]
MSRRRKAERVVPVYDMPGNSESLTVLEKLDTEALEALAEIVVAILDARQGDPDREEDDHAEDDDPGEDNGDREDDSEEEEDDDPMECDTANQGFNRAAEPTPLFQTGR